MDDAASRMTTVMAGRLEARRHAIARDLRRLADDVERTEPKADLRTLEIAYSPVARDILHHIFWGVANLGLDGFAADCAELDIMLANERTTI